MIWFQSLKGLILTTASASEYLINEKFQSLKGLILTLFLNISGTFLYLVSIPQRSDFNPQST